MPAPINNLAFNIRVPGQFLLPQQAANTYIGTGNNNRYAAPFPLNQSPFTYTAPLNRDVVYISANEIATQNLQTAETSKPPLPDIPVTNDISTLVSEVANKAVNVTDSDTLGKAKAEGRSLAEQLMEYGVDPDELNYQDPATAAQMMGLITEAKESLIDTQKETWKGALFGTIGGAIGWVVRTVFFDQKNNAIFAGLFLTIGAGLGALMTRHRAKKEAKEQYSLLVQQLSQFSNLS